MSESGRQRLDKWLWYARFFKTRSLAAKFVTSGHIRVNKEKVSKASASVKPEDVLTFPLGPHVRVIKVLDPGVRRGPAPEARTLYEDLAPPQPRTAEEKQPESGQREPGSGRPTKKERRQLEAIHPKN